MAKATATVALALALLGPGTIVTPSPGGDEGSRSTPPPPDLLMVNVNETTCLAPAAAGGVFAGTDGGGIASWTEGGTLDTLQTTTNGMIATNHIVDLVTDYVSSYAIGATVDPLIYSEVYAGNWHTRGEVEGALGPLTVLEGGDGLLVIDSRGTVFLSPAGISWVELDPQFGIPSSGWMVADRDQDTIALSNGTDIVLVDLQASSVITIPTPPIQDIDLAGDMIAIASFDHPDVYDLKAGTWLGTNVTQALSDIGQGWSLVKMEGHKFVASTFDGIVVEVNVTVGTSEGVKLRGTLSDGVDANVTDMLLLANDTVLLSTLKGNWVIRDGQTEPFLSTPLSMPPSNDILSVGYEAETLWVLTPSGLSFLVLDSRGMPTRWEAGPDLGPDATTETMDTAYLEGRVYICGYGPGIHTYDTFASSATSRWGRTHIYGDARDDVTDLVVVNGTIYVGGPFGLDRMVPGSDPPNFELVPGSPAGVLSLQYSSGYHVYVGTEQGLWAYDLTISQWNGPNEVFSELPKGPVTDMVRSSSAFYMAIDNLAYVTSLITSDGLEPLTFQNKVNRLTSRLDVADPVWCVAGGRAFAIVEDQVPGPGGPSTIWTGGEYERERLGDARIRDASMAPSGTVYLATDSGLHIIDRFDTSWSSWTTSNGLSANDIRTLSYVGQERALWVGAYGGVDVINTETDGITRIGVEDGLPSNLVYDIEMDGKDVWIGTDVGGASKANRGQLMWQAYNMTTGLIADDVQAVAVWGDYVLFGTDEGVTVFYRGDSTIESYTASSSELPGNWVWCVLSHETGIYVGTDSGLARFEPDEGLWHEYNVEGISGHAVRSLDMRVVGDLWVGTDDGLYILSKDGSGIPSEEEVKHVDRSGGLPGDEVLALKSTSDGEMWVGTSAGAAVMDADLDNPFTVPGVQATFDTASGLVHDRVNAIEEGPDGTIWLGTAGGLSQLTKSNYRTRPQWMTTTVDLPDVYVTLADVLIDPEEPNEGDEVTFEIVVSNPSGKRAIVHVGLFTDDEGAIGEEVSSAIAYTEPGDSYTVSLNWTAVGGERNLWVVMDPEDLVPESNERNNVVALSIHVNRSPDISNLVMEGPWGNIDPPDQTAYVDLGFVYKDEDGDAPQSAVARVVETGQTSDLVIPSGDPLTGIQFGFEGVDVPLGNSTISIEVSDGRARTSLQVNVSVHLSIQVRGLEKGRNDDGEVRLSVDVVGPWEGEVVNGVEVLFAEPGTDTSDPNIWDRIWVENLSLPAVQDGEEWVVDASKVEAGRYDIWVLASDDRQIMALYVEENVKIEKPSGEEGVDWVFWGVMIWIIAAIVIALVGMWIWRDKE